MIRDHLVVGMLDTSLSECLQVDANLMLEEAKQIVRQCEAIHNHGEKPAEMTLSYVNTVKRSRNQPKTNASQQQRPQQPEVHHVWKRPTLGWCLSYEGSHLPQVQEKRPLRQPALQQRCSRSHNTHPSLTPVTLTSPTSVSLGLEAMPHGIPLSKSITRS